MIMYEWFCDRVLFCWLYNNVPPGHNGDTSNREMYHLYEWSKWCQKSPWCMAPSLPQKFCDINFKATDDLTIEFFQSEN